MREGSEPDPVELAKALLRFNSVTPECGPILAFIEKHLSSAGLECTRCRFDEPNTAGVDNLYARFGHGYPHLSFAGHVDVVPPGDETQWRYPPFSAIVAGEEMYGRGAVDMKGGVAAFIAALLRFTGAGNLKNGGTVSLLLTGDEEGPAINGTVKLLSWAVAAGVQFDHCLVGEPTCRNRLGDVIKIGRRGSLSGTLIVDGIQGHVAYPHHADNPLPALAKLLAHISACRLDEGSAHFEPSNLEIVGIDVGNSAWNVIPASGRGRFNIRYNDHWNRDLLADWLAQRCAEIGIRQPYRLEFEPAKSDVFVTQPGKLSAILSDVVHQICGIRPELSTGGGTSDARFIKDYCEVIEFGLVGQSMHGIDERVRVQDVRDLCEIYYRFLGEYFSSFKR